MREKRKHKEDIVRLIASLPDGTHIVEHSDGKLERRKSETDWRRMKALSDAQIDSAIANDPDWRDLGKLDWSEVELIAPPKKKPISIRVDEDVLDFFKKEGGQYQRRINAVLRSYMQQRKNKKRA